jgi:DegV family protein with EDD domain
LNFATELADEMSASDFAIALRSGIYRVMSEQDNLNRINVFPVADGDTGTNLSLSLGAALGIVNNPVNEPLGRMLASIADAMLDGARGNSGAIVAQFFQGMSDAAEGLEVFTSSSFSAAVRRGSDYAHDALSNPKEGTILSVVRALADALAEQSARTANISFTELFRSSISSMRAALERTQTQLDVLRKAGVVDAGAKGFVALISGISDFVTDGTETGEPPIAAQISSGPSLEMAGSDNTLDYRFCTECIVTGDDIDRRKLRESLAEVGDSLVLAGTKRKARIHIHVNEPEMVFDIARRHGTLALEKADDMRRQQHSTHNSRTSFAVITDSAADISDDAMERLDIHMVPARIQFGDRGYLDKVSISANEFFHELASNPAHPTTSQPAPGDFRRQFQFLASHFSDVIYVSLSPAVSGTYQAAQSAALRIAGPGKIHVVNSRNASVGQGQLAILAAECAEAGLDIETALAALEKAIPVTSTFALIKDLRYAVRGGRVPAGVKILADLLRVSPVLRTTMEGEVKARGVLAGRRNCLSSFASYIARRSSKERKLRVAIGNAMCLDQARELVSMLHERLPLIVDCQVMNLGSAVGVHGGPGTLVVGVQEHFDPETITQTQRHPPAR